MDLLSGKSTKKIALSNENGKVNISIFRMRLGIAKSENFVFRLSLFSPFTIFAKISLMDNV